MMCSMDIFLIEVFVSPQEITAKYTMAQAGIVEAVGSAMKIFKSLAIFHFCALRDVVVIESLS